MSNRFGKGNKYIAHTSYFMVAAFILLIAALGGFIHIGLRAMEIVVTTHPNELPWDVLAFSAISGLIGTTLAIIAMRRLS